MPLATWLGSDTLGELTSALPKTPRQGRLEGAGTGREGYRRKAVKEQMEEGTGREVKVELLFHCEIMHLILTQLLRCGC